MNDYEIAIWYNTYSFGRRLDRTVVAFVYDNAENVGASLDGSFWIFQNLTSLYFIDHTIQLRVKGALDVYLQFQNYIPVSAGCATCTISKEQPPPPSPKSVNTSVGLSNSVSNKLN